MNIPTEPIGSIPRPLPLIEAINAEGDGTDPSLDALYEEATRDTIEQFEATGSPVITDGEQRKYHNFWTYSVHGLKNTSPDGFKIPFSAGHTRRMLRLTAEPFRYKRYADQYLDLALRYAHVPLKQAVISPSALSLMYPAEGIAGYSRDQFIEDLLREHETEVRRCLQKGAYKVQIDFTEGRLASKDRSVRQPVEHFHRPEQSRAVPVLRGGPTAHRRAYLPRRRPGFHPQRGCRLRRAAPEPVRAQRGKSLHRAGGRDGSAESAQDHQAVLAAGSEDLRGRGRADRSSSSKRRKRSVTGSWRLRSTFRSSSSAQRMTADSLRSVMTRPRLVRRHLPKFAPESLALRSRPKRLGVR